MASKTVSLVVNGKTYNKTTNSTGYAVFNIPTLNPGVYSATVKFGGGSNYASCSKVINVTVNKISTKLVVDSSKIDEDNILSATLQDSNGNCISNKVLSLNIGNISYSGTSDSKGKVSFSLDSLSPGNYSWVVEYNGDNIYMSSTKIVDIVILNKSDSFLYINYMSQNNYFEFQDILDSAYNLNSFINQNKYIPNTVQINDKNCSVDEMVYLMSKIISNLQNGDVSGSYIPFIKNSQYKEFSTKQEAMKEEYRIKKHLSF